ncbi:MAG: CZB domain-containing protein [Gammaproteobacteria bacterium]|nr:CZB domain-containing protein [Gammaproteobacteria bacterium]
MKNLSLQFKFQLLIHGYNLLLFTLLVTLFIQHGFNIWYLGFWVFAIPLGIFALIWIRAPFRLINEWAAVMEDAANGEFKRRITQPPATPELNALAWHINDMLDQMEPFFREVDTTFSNAVAGKFYRKTQPDGLHGEFKQSLIRINESLHAMEANALCINRNELLSRLSNLNTEKMLANLKLNQQDMITITEQMSSVVDIAARNSEMAAAAQHSLERITNVLDGILSRVDQTGRAIQKLNERSVEMTSMISLIAGVADQTNLLALNAAIEAARAGEHGRGFAVVADEVRNLAANTKNATNEITQMISNIIEDTEKMMADAEQMRAMANDSQGEMVDFKEKYSGFAESSRTTLQKIDYAQSINFASLVKLDHLVYKQNAYIAVNKGVDADEASAVWDDHHSCRLGKWYDEGEGREKFSRTKSFKALEQPHAEVHRSIHEAVHHIAQDWERNQEIKEKILTAFKSAEESSDRVMDLVDRMVKEQDRFASAADYQ